MMLHFGTAAWSNNTVASQIVLVNTYVTCAVFASELIEIDTLRGVLDISLFFYTSLIAVSVDVVLALPHLLSTIYHTQVCHSGSGTVTSVYHTQVCHSGSGICVPHTGMS